MPAKILENRIKKLTPRDIRMKKMREKTGGPYLGTRKGKKRTRWDSKFPVSIYIMATQGMTIPEIAKSLGVSWQTMKLWSMKRQSVRDALDRGNCRFQEVKHDRGLYGGTTFRGYVFQRLPRPLRKLWRQIREFERKKKPGQIELLLKGQSKIARMNLFLYAYTASNFNASKACRRVNVPLTTYNQWREDKDFADLMNAMLQCRKDVFEEALMKKVKEGDTAAVLFANKTLNRDRGYNDKAELEIRANIQHEHKHLVNIEELGLPLETMKVILEAIRNKRLEQKEKKQADIITPALEYVRKGNNAVPIDESDQLNEETENDDHASRDDEEET